jgi:hypothetical protein
MRLTLPLNSFSAVASGQTATVKIAGQRRIHALILQTGAADATQTAAQVREIRFKLGSLTLVKLTVAQLYALNAYYGITVGAGELPLYFSKAQSRTPTGEEFTALNAFGLDDMTVEVEFRSIAEYVTAGGTGGTFTPTLNGLAVFDYTNDGNRSFIQTTDRLIASSGAGDVDFDTLEREGAYKAIHIFSGLVNRVRVYRDGLELVDRTLAQVAAINRPYGLTAQANHFPVDFGYTNQAMDILEMSRSDGTPTGKVRVNTFNLKLTTTGAGALPAIVERVILL